MLMQSYWKSFAIKNSVSLKVSGIDGEDSFRYDVIINATSAGFSSNISPIEDIMINKETYCYDMTYSVETPFMKQAKNMNAIVSDGLGMLIEQAAESFYIWHKKKPKTKNIKSQLKKLKLI
tara:strand:- start:227 stop:589 length:363 start_codon:yes stop_codon:yes gene_type:complete